MFRPSGGLLYHYRAWRHLRTWAPFKAEVAAWLEAWPCPRTELIVIGASGGYTLPTPWLRTFGRVRALDLDPFAPLFFRRVHPGVRVRFERRDVFWQDARLSLAPLSELVARAPVDAVFLFSNVLGQILLENHASEREWLQFLKALRQPLAGRYWASYHDVYSEENGVRIDHLLDGAWTAGLEQTRFEWRLTPSRRHTIAGVRSI